MHERRTQRSDCRGHALRLWLNAVTERAGLDEIVVSDSGGLLIAASTTCHRPNELAVHAATSHELTSELSAANDDDPRGALVVRRLRWRDDALLVCARGPAGLAQVGVQDAAAGISRILA